MTDHEIGTTLETTVALVELPDGRRGGVVCLRLVCDGVEQQFLIPGSVLEPLVEKLEHALRAIPVEFRQPIPFLEVSGLNADKSKMS